MTSKPPQIKHTKTTMDKQTAAHKRFQAYYMDYLLNYDSIGSYAASHKLTYETAKHRIKTGERVQLSMLLKQTATQ